MLTDNGMFLKALVIKKKPHYFHSGSMYLSAKFRFMVMHDTINVEVNMLNK